MNYCLSMLLIPSFLCYLWNFLYLYAIEYKYCARLFACALWLCVSRINFPFRSAPLTYFCLTVVFFANHVHVPYVYWPTHFYNWILKLLMVFCRFAYIYKMKWLFAIFVFFHSTFIFFLIQLSNLSFSTQPCTRNSFFIHKHLCNILGFVMSSFVPF